MDAHKPRLLVLTTTFPRWQDDNLPPFVFELSRRLRDFEVHVLAPHTKGALAYEIMEHVHVHRFRYGPARWERLAYEGGIPTRLRRQPWLRLMVPLLLLGFAWRGLRLGWKLRPAVIHAHWVMPQGLLALILRNLVPTRPRVLVTAHGADLHTFTGGLGRASLRWVLRRADAVTAVSEALARKAEALGATRPRVLPMGVDLATRFVPRADATPHRPTLICAGRLVEKKGIDNLIRATALLIQQFPDVKVIIAGSGPMLESLRALATELGVEQNVDFHGAYQNTDLPGLITRASVAVFPFVEAGDGDQEGFGLVVVEAMGCAIPVVVSELAALRDIVRPDHTGLLVPPGDVPALAEAITDLLRDPDRARRLATAGRDFALSRFDWKRIATSYGDLLLQLKDARQ